MLVGTDFECIPCLLKVGLETRLTEYPDWSAPSVGTVVPRAESALSLTPPYEDRGLVGLGGMGEVRRVYDHSLDRTMVMKIIRAEALGDPSLVARFVEEARATAQLQHPGIVPVHELGLLPDGRPFYTMKEVTGQTLAEVIVALHVEEALPDWTLRRVLLAFHQACKTVAYAHAHAVIHRDLKPGNIMVGGHGQVMVIDWGLVKYLGARPGPQGGEGPLWTGGTLAHPDEALTRAGTIAGTPAYMPPEQAQGQTDSLGPQSDVYALGAILFEILTAHPPSGPGGDGLGPLPPETPPELVALCERAMAPQPSERFAHAGALADALQGWLDARLGREKADAILAASEMLPARIATLRGRARALRLTARRDLEKIPLHAPEARKHEAWELEDEATGQEDEAAVLEMRYVQELRGALNHAAEHEGAHRRLAELYHTKHREAEASGDAGEAEQWALMLEAHNVAGAYASYLEGSGAITLETDPSGAEVELYRYVLRQRRLQPERVGSLGVTPLKEMPVPMGSYLLKIRASGHAEVCYPVFIKRQQHWDGIRPGDARPTPIWLPPEGALAEDERYVPAGWFWSGGDKAEAHRRVWVDPFVIKRHPVTHQDYVDFLNDLIDAGREPEALRHAPRRPAPGQEGEEVHDFARDARGHFTFAGVSKVERSPHLPVFRVDWAAAVAYCHWYARRSGRAWSLPGELEWEKAARGVDGRAFPWGSFADPSWANVRDSVVRKRMPRSVLQYPEDCGPYGVRGMAGNVSDVCGETYDPSGPRIEGGIFRPPAAEPPWEVPEAVDRDGSEAIARAADAYIRQADEEGRHRVARGGNWFHDFEAARLGVRHAGPGRVYFVNFGFRMCVRIARGAPP